MAWFFIVVVVVVVVVVGKRRLCSDISPIPFPFFFFCPLLQTESLSFDPVTVHTKMIVHQLEKSKGLGSAFDDDVVDDDDDDDDESGSASLIGETGICFDHNDGEAYATTPPGEILALQTSAYDTLMAAIDAALASVTLWNYTPDNTNLHGDGWNEEDLSLFSYDQQHDPDNVHSGGRGLPAVVRPYASR